MKSPKPNKLNLYEMWEVYLLNSKVSARGISQTVKMLYPKISQVEMSTDKRLELYSFGLSWNLFSTFSQFVKSLGQSNGK